jgi:4-hydroxy-3-polyprenylbenzoate decarboxylase
MMSSAITIAKIGRLMKKLDIPDSCACVTRIVGQRWRTEVAAAALAGVRNWLEAIALCYDGCFRNHLDIGMKPATPARPRFIVGISGASGVVYGIRLLQLLRQLDVETHLVMSKSAQVTLAHETDLSVADVRALADVTYSNADIGAAIASGSFKVEGMVVAPCSIRTMSEIATGVTGSLLSRAADVMLKERKRLVLMLRETPLHLGHLRSMTAVTEAGAIVYPPVPAFYARPQSIEQMVDHTLGRVLDLFGLDAGTVTRWEPARNPEAE